MTEPRKNKKATPSKQNEAKYAAGAAQAKAAHKSGKVIKNIPVTHQSGGSNMGDKTTKLIKTTAGPMRGAAKPSLRRSARRARNSAASPAAKASAKKLY